MALQLVDRWIWDSWFIRDGDTQHAFYLQASRALGDPDRRHRHPVIGHATSTDLRHWTVAADALIVSEPPAFDDAATWTGSVIRDDADGRWWMFYTGLCEADGRHVQRIGSATSTDLVHWHKRSPRAVVEADPRWYNTPGPPGDTAWRDPWVFRSEGETGWRMLVTAGSPHPDPHEVGVIGHARSDDLVHWSVTEPLGEPGRGFGQLEVPQFAIIDGVPLVLFSCGGDELGADRRAAGETGGIYSVVVDAALERIDPRRAHPFEAPELYAGRLVTGADGRWNLLGFINNRDGHFVGALGDPVPVTADPALGLVRR